MFAKSTGRCHLAGRGHPKSPFPEGVDAAEHGVAVKFDPVPKSLPLDASVFDAASEEPPPWAADILLRIAEVDAKLSKLLQQRMTKNWYSTEEAGEILGKSEYTVREWCRHGRVRGQKKGSGRGKYQSWVIAHAELLRIQKDGLLPVLRS